MKVYFFVLTSFPYGMAAGKRRLCYAKGLMAAGLECQIVVCRKTEPGTTQPEMPDEGIFNGIKYIYISGKVRNKNKFIRKIDDLIDLCKGFFYSLNHVKKGDIIYSYFYGNLFHLILILAGKIKGAKVVKELCEYPFVFGKQTLINNLKRIFELKCIFPLFDGFIAISNSLEELSNKYKSKHARVIKVPILVEKNYPDVTFDSMNSDIEVPYILHTGTMNDQKDGISEIIQAFAIAINQLERPVKLVFTGPNPTQRKEYDNLIVKYHLKERIIFTGMLSSFDLAKYQYFSSLSIINKKNNLQNRNCFPTKLGEMLIYETAVITTNVGDANIYLKDGVSAYIVESDHPDLLAKKIISAFRNNEERNRIAKAGRKVAQLEFDCLYHGERLAKYFLGLNKN